MTEDSGETSSRHARYCLVLRRSQVISSSNCKLAAQWLLYKKTQHEALSPEVKTSYTEVFLFSQHAVQHELEQSARRSRRCHLSRIVQETSRQLYKVWAYISDLLTSVANIPGRSTLHASSSGNLVVPRTRRRIGDRAFSVAAPRAWNRLPTEVKLLRSTDLFRRDLKTFLFHSVYGHQDTD